MSQHAKSIIIGLLNRNPSKRLGSGFGGVEEIKRHPFFEELDWSRVERRELNVMRPKWSLQHFQQQY